MKKYIFEKGSIVDELTADDIKRHEAKLGRLLGVMINGRMIPCQYDDKQKPIEELWLFKNKKPR